MHISAEARDGAPS